MERNIRDVEQRALLYDPDLTTYSVASHVVAFATGVSDVSQNLALTNKIADIVLNLVDAGFSGLRPTTDFGNPGQNRLRGFRKSMNRGYAFCCLAFGLREHVGAGIAGRKEIDLAMRSAGLPTVKKVYTDAKIVIDNVPGRLARDPKLAEIRGKLLEAGRRLHRQPDFDANFAALCPDNDNPAPLLCDSECEVFSLGSAPLEMAEYEFLNECQERYREVLRSALRAARGFEFEFTDFVY